MASREEQELLTRVGPGTGMGELLRRYWQPAALGEELPPGGPPLPVRLLGEDLVLFRDEQGRPGLLGLHCSHRGADLSYGRIEDGGLRCLYHGWLYDVQGRCLEQPGEAAGRRSHWGGRDSAPSSNMAAQDVGGSDEPGSPAGAARSFRERIRHTAYPCVEHTGIIFAYLGPGEPPLLPAYEFLSAPDGFWSSSKTFQECNFLQGNEGNLDPAHLSFLHRLAADGSTEDGVRQSLNTRFTCPTIEPEITDFGVRIYAVRPAGPDRTYVRVTNFILPNLSGVAGDREGYSVNWHMPIDDTHHWRYGIRFNRSTPVDPRRRLGADKTSDYWLTRNNANRYLQDRDEMQTQSFSGLGRNFILHDTMATEGEGPVQDRTTEHLGYTDRGLFAARKVLLAAIRDVQAGREPPHVVRNPVDNHFERIVVRNDLVLPASVDWHRFWERADVEIQETRELASRVAE
ncbi:MAG: Rieske 2Fe-2S domain-containing protein [Chloroflexi bacterium]|nr:Rieske 2Fe-2S domain-containing protein [Chloroflexota bacterium]